MGTTNHQTSLADEWAEDSSDFATQRYLPRPERISSIPPLSGEVRSQSVKADSPINWSTWQSAATILTVVAAGFWFGATLWTVDAQEESDAPTATEAPLVLDADRFAPVSVESAVVPADPDEEIPSELDEPTPVESTVDRASRGDALALETLSQKAPEERSFEEVVALSEGRVQRQRDLAWAAAILFTSQNFERGRAEQIPMILAVTGDPRTFREGLLSLARIKHPIGPELIYQASQKYSHLPEVVVMAEELLGTQAVRSQASLELSVVIDAIFVSECKAARELLERALEDGDRRAVPHLARLEERHGCGADGRADCFSCIRNDDLLQRALQAAQSRRAPQWK